MADIHFDKEDTTNLRAFGQPHGMSLAQFVVMLRLYKYDYIDIGEYDDTPICIRVTQVNGCRSNKSPNELGS